MIAEATEAEENNTTQQVLGGKGGFFNKNSVQTRNDSNYDDDVKRVEL